MLPLLRVVPPVASGLCLNLSTTEICLSWNKKLAVPYLMFITLSPVSGATIPSCQTLT